MAAAQLLRRKAGGRAIPRLDATAHAAARAYNGAGPVAEAYAGRVMVKARAWQAAGQQPGGGAPPAYGGSGRLAWPVSPRTPITSPFGPRWGRLHAGIDLGAPTGTPITASEAGRVSLLWHTPGGRYGNYLCIQHAARLSSCYADLSRFAGGIRAGASVRRGELVGYSGCTGRCFGDHLHYEVRLGPPTRRRRSTPCRTCAASSRCVALALGHVALGAAGVAAICSIRRTGKPRRRSAGKP